MLIIFTRAIIIFIFLLITMRLMGKKQLGELQPFEFAISLIVADLACIPMSDISVPISYGLVPIFTLFVLHLFVGKILKHSIKLRGLINGNPIIVITPKGIDYKMLKKLDMTVTDLIEALREAGYFSPSEVAYGIVETNGTLSVLPNRENKPIALGDIDDNGHKKKIEEPDIPVTVIVEGKVLSENMKGISMQKNTLDSILKKHSLTAKKVLLLTINGQNVYIQPKSGDAISATISEVSA